jgi:LuxR family maltose regulon positive regulatory protein
MAAPLLTTKLYIPPVQPEVVPRPRLIAHLNAGLERKLTLVSAPAGYGKTTLISTWLRAADVPFAWLSLDEGDNDPVRFFTYLLAALQGIDVQIGQAVQGWLEAPQPPELNEMAAALINDISATSRSFVLVLDDHHVITERGIHESLSFLLERQPPQMHLVIATRHDPPLPLARLRARGELVELRQSNLCFTTEEATAFLNQSLGLDLSASEAALLGRRTEGWIAGLQLAGLSMRGRDAESVARFIREFSGRHHFILDYLTDEVLKRQAEPVQEFLLRTSILERMCGALCEALVARDAGPDGSEGRDGQAMLEELQQANLFVVPLDDERQWYRYHHLFAQLLRARLEETRPGLATDLHRRAAAWHEENGLGFGAAQHALASGDYALAAAVVERTILKLDIWSSTEITTVLGWMKALPDDVVRHRPWLRLFIARTLYVSGQWEKTDQMLQDLEDWLYEHPETPEAQRLLALVVADRAGYALVRGEVRKGRELVRRMLARASQDEMLIDVRAEAMLGMAHVRAGEVVEAERAFSRAVNASPAGRVGYAIAPIICNLAETYYLQGQLMRTWQTCEQAIEAGTVDGQRHATTGFAGLLQGKILYEWNDLEAAERCLQEGLDLLRRGGIGSHFGNLYATLAQTRQARGDHEGAGVTIEQAVRTAQNANIPRLTIQALASRARIWLAQEDLASALRWADEYRQIGATEYIREFEDCTLARVLLADDRPGEALVLLDGMAPLAEDGGRRGTLIEILVLRALARQALAEASAALGEQDAALDDLARALDLAEPERYARTFLDLGEPLAVLLKQAATRGFSPVYTSKLLMAFGDEGLRGPVPAPSGAQPLVEPLSDRELEVLQLLAEGLSNPEIGQRLFISLPTVKSHTRNIYGKLGVHSRKQAVAQARALGILPPL